MQKLPQVYYPVIVGTIICLVGLIDWFFVTGRVEVGKTHSPTCTPAAGSGWLMLAVILAQPCCLVGMFFLGRRGGI
jgi:hypothetical protein